MKICRIVNGYSPYSFGGADMYAEITSRECAKRNNEEIIITINPLKGDTFEERNNIKIYRFYPLNISTIHSIGRKPFLKQCIWSALDIYSWYSYRKIINILKKEKPDIVHFHTPPDATLSAFDAVKSLSLPLVFALNDYLLLCRRAVLLHGSKKMCTNTNINPLCKVYRNFSRKIVDNKPDVVIAPSNFALEEFRRNGFFYNCKTVVLPRGIELNNYHLPRRDNHKQNFNLLYVGSLTHHKGIHVLIEAVRGIQNKYLRLDIVGEGSYGDKLKVLAKNDSRIVFHGKVNNEDKYAFYNSADLLVVPSIWNEVFGLVILEAFRAGLPVIGSRIGGIPELISDNHNGYLFTPGDHLELKRILENIIEQPEKLALLGRGALDSVKQYEMSQHIDKLISIYKDAIEINNHKKTTLKR